MSIKIDTLDRWQLLAKGSTLTLPGKAPRRIRLNVNSPGRARLYVVNEDGELQFLAAPDGRNVVEFAMAGDAVVTTEDDDVYVYSAENEPTFSVIENAEVFTKIAERAGRNPDLEHMMYQQTLNMERRIARLSAEMETKIGAAYEAGKATIVHSNAPGTTAEEPLSEEPKPDGDGSSPVEAGGEAEPSPAPASTGS